MIKRVLLMALIVLVLPLGVFAQETMPEPAITQAEAILNQFLTGDYAGIYAQLSEEIQAMVSLEEIQQAWEGLIEQVGEFQSVVATRYEAGANTGILTMQFAAIQLDLRVSFDENDTIIGLQFAQPPSAEPTPAPMFSAPPYADLNAFTETDVTIGEGDLSLPGTLSLPNGEGTFPAVILLAGSGPNDRDETYASNKPLRDIAWGLASQGIAVLRYDKVTFAHGSALDILTFTIDDEIVNDALLAVELLRGTEGVDPSRIFVAGHSLGGYVLPRIGAADAEIAGLIYLAALARPLQEVIIEQQTYLVGLDGTISEADQRGIDAIQTIADQINELTSEDADDDTLLIGAPAVYWLDLQDYNPAESAAALDVPMLFIQGERDYQVTVERDLSLWQAALEGRDDVTFVTFPSLNHHMIPGDGQPNPTEYDIAGHVDGGVVNTIVEWVESN